MFSFLFVCVLICVLALSVGTAQMDFDEIFRIGLGWNILEYFGLECFMND